jgi:hypothetical protein
MEHHEQAALFQWAEYNKNTYPELGLLYATPNGAFLNSKTDRRGHRYSPEAAKLKAEGLKPGVPDICLPVARSVFHGLYIELKFGDNTASPQQRNWIEALREQGYRALVVTGWEAAASVIVNYLQGRI